MRSWHVTVVALVLGLVPTAHSQTVEVNRQNRTVEVIVTEKVQVDADIANITVGCISYGQTHDQAYQSNLEIANKVIKALTGAGVQKSQIESSSIELGEAESSEVAQQPSAVRKVRQFKAHQSWRIRVAASDAQKLVDTAVQAGANGIEYVTWDVAAPEALENRARAAAVAKARATAAELAQSNGGKLGDMLYASNAINGILGLLNGQRLNTTSASVGGGGGGVRTPTFSLQLFPEKIERQATVRTIFALE